MRLGTVWSITKRDVPELERAILAMLKEGHHPSP